jgi:hypothetical protein
MTKQELLASLKPLKWKYCNIFGGEIAETPLGVYGLDLDAMGYFDFIFVMNNKMDRQSGAPSNTRAKLDSQEHYNNLVFNLFNLED